MNKKKIKIDTINLYEEIYKINMILSSLEKEYINIRDITVTSLDEVDNSYNYYKDFEKNIRDLIIRFRKLNNMVVGGVIQKYNSFDASLNYDFNNLKTITENIRSEN